MTKRFLIILVMVSWSSISFAENLKYDCRYDNDWYSYLKRTIDFDKKIYTEEWAYNPSGKYAKYCNPDCKRKSTLKFEIPNVSNPEISVKATFRDIYPDVNSPNFKHKKALKKAGGPDSFVWEKIINLNTLNYSFTFHHVHPKADFVMPYCSLTSGNIEVATTESKKIEIASMIDEAKDTCKSLGFKEGTEKFSDCALKLYSQSVELAAKQNQQIVMQPQSSGSNVMTIYDPVRDSNALMDKGMKMLTGRCTLGYDC